MQLSDIVPWGRTLAEYREMFSLSPSDLQRKILGCADGPASFNAEVSASGSNVVSVDPIYRFTAKELADRIADVSPQVMEQIAENKDDFVWTSIPNPASLLTLRMKAMNQFLEDYAVSSDTGRYVDAALPNLPFGDGAFDLALCSHFLFLYSSHVSAQQHVDGLLELCRVADEVRVYPLLSIEDNQPSPHLSPVRAELEDRGIETSVVEVSYEFQKGATAMLVAKRN